MSEQTPTMREGCGAERRGPRSTVGSGGGYAAARLGRDPLPTPREVTQRRGVDTPAPGRHVYQDQSQDKDQQLDHGYLLADGAARPVAVSRQPSARSSGASMCVVTRRTAPLGCVIVSHPVT